MNFIVIGCGRVGAQLAYRLFQKGHKVTVLDYNPGAFKNLPAGFLGRVVEGEATHLDVLRRAGIEHADGIAVVTSEDSINAVVGHVARSAFNMTNIVVRNFDPVWRPMLDAFNLQVISSSSWGAQRIEELLYNAEIRSVFSAGNGEVEIYEFTVPAAIEHLNLSELLPESGCLPVGLTRAGQAILSSSETVLERGDVVMVSATLAGIEGLQKRLQTLQERTLI